MKNRKSRRKIQYSVEKENSYEKKMVDGVPVHLHCCNGRMREKESESTVAANAGQEETTASAESAKPADTEESVLPENAEFMKKKRYRTSLQM